RNRDAEPARDHAIDADHGAVERSERTARVARREPDIGPKPRIVAVRHSVEHADAERAGNAEGMSERDDDLTRAQDAGATDGRGSGGGPLVRDVRQRQRREVQLAIASDHHRLHNVAVGALDIRLVTATWRHDVGVGDDHDSIAAPPEDAGPYAGASP